MPFSRTLAAVSASAALTLVACGETSKLPFSAGVGPNPKLPEANATLLPTVKVAEAIGWSPDETPSSAAGTVVQRFADGLEHPRWLHVLPNGDVLVAESNKPPQPENDRGIEGFFVNFFMKKAGAGVPSANRITLLRDADGDGKAEVRRPYIEGLNSPFGIALVGRDLYVANTDSIVRFPYDEGKERIDSAPEKIVDLPGGPMNHHWTKNIVANADGTKLYATVGSNSNAGEQGMAVEEGRAAIWEVDLASRARRLFATGLRNPNGMDWEPDTGALWVVVNERDGLGSDLVPDYLTSVRDGGFYGWPYSYFGRHVDERVEPPRPDLVAKAIVPDYALGTHVAALGLSFADGSKLPENLRNGAFIGEHGSWNRDPPAGYKVVFVPFRDGKPSGPPLDLLTGFLTDDGKARGRPVGVAIDGTGALLVADDVGNAVWRVSAAP